MALELDTATTASLNGSNNDNNGNTTGVVVKTNNNHSPSSNDSGFHSDQLQQHQQSRTQRAMSRNRGNIKHKPTYVSVFASDPDNSSPLFDEFDRRFATNRPNFLKDTLHLPVGNEETCSIPAIAIPLIMPSKQSISPSFMNISVSSDPTIHPESSKQVYLNQQEDFSTSSASIFQQEQEPQPPHLATSSEASSFQKLHDATTSSNILSSNGISNSNQSTQETSEQKIYKYAHPKIEMQKNMSYISKQKDEKSGTSIRESLNDFCSKFQKNSPIEPEEFYITLTKSLDLPTTKLPHGNSLEPKETVEALDICEQYKSEKLHDDRVTMKQSSAHEIYQLSPDSVVESLPESIPAESGIASALQSLPRHQEIPVSEFLASKATSRHSQESYNINLEEPPLFQTLSCNLEFGMTSQEKLESRLVKAEQFIDCHENSESFEPTTMKSKDTSNAETYLEKNRFVSFVPSTKLNQIVPQRPDSLMNLDDSEKFTSSVFEESAPNIPTKFISPPQENFAISISKRPEYSRGNDWTVSTNEFQNTTSSNKFGKPIVPVAPRRAKDDNKSIPFNKLIEKAIFFTKADNGAVPTPKTFQSVASVANSSRSTTMRSNNNGVPKTTTLNLRASKDVPFNGKIINDKFTGINPAETSRNKFSTTENATVLRAENLFAKTAEPLPLILAPQNTAKKFISTTEENIKMKKFSNIVRQSEKVERRSSIITKQKESLEVCSPMTKKESNARMHPCLSETGSSMGVTVKGLDFSRFDNKTDDDMIEKSLEANETEQTAPQIIKAVTSNTELHKQEQPSEVELIECKNLLDEEFADYDILKVILKRSASNPEGSIGVILSSAASGDQYISVQRVISGSIADRSDLIEKGDRVFFVQGYSTKQMSAADARTLIKQKTEHVIFVLGRLKTKSGDVPAKPAKFVSNAVADPDLFNYSTDSEEVMLTKGNLGVGLALDGGRGSVFGDRPIVIKRVFEGGSAARSGRIKVGDQVVTIDGIDVRGMSYLEATKTLRSRPEGPLKLVILRRLQ
ncbi:unnamed protein product [Onchocerca flexuosa]|uniref:PDZ/DHR/GLGF domain protein n=1 Tax=Onchocerca flexuosa TaxID=387005 RepID=A0A183HYE1_9BILA|nr:unnamed protein product [Onchocerca flexuosa]